MKPAALGKIGRACLPRYPRWLIFSVFTAAAVTGCSIFLCHGWPWLFSWPLILRAGSIYLVVTRLAVNGRAKTFKAVSPGMLPPLGILFALLVGFIAVEVWSNFDKAKAAVATEASALRAVVLLAETFPEDRRRASTL